MFKIGDRVKIYCKGHSLHLKECNIIGYDRGICTLVDDDDKFHHAGFNRLIYPICIYANDTMSK